MREEEGRSI
jgi:hypothetical protein